MNGIIVKLHGGALRARIALTRALATLGSERRAQGTIEYAILVGVLVVIAISAVLLFRGKVAELWDSIASSINGL